jgi:hypothetical protein
MTSSSSGPASGSSNREGHTEMGEVELKHDYKPMSIGKIAFRMSIAAMCMLPVSIVAAKVVKEVMWTKLQLVGELFWAVTGLGGILIAVLAFTAAIAGIVHGNRPGEQDSRRYAVKAMIVSVLYVPAWLVTATIIFMMNFTW